MVENGRQTFNPSDPRSLVAQDDDERQRKLWIEKRRDELLAKTGDVVKAAQEHPDTDSSEIIKYVALILITISVITFGTAYGLIYYLDYSK